MTEICIMLGVIIVLVLIFRLIAKKSKKKDCGTTCLFPQRKTPSLPKTKSRSERLKEIREKIENARKGKKKKEKKNERI